MTQVVEFLPFWAWFLPSTQNSFRNSMLAIILMGMSPQKLTAYNGFYDSQAGLRMFKGVGRCTGEFKAIGLVFNGKAQKLDNASKTLQC